MEIVLPQLLKQLPNTLVALIIFIFILYPRFNRWPENEIGRLVGKPKDYIHRRRYYLYAALYLATFALFALALSNVKALPAITDWLAEMSNSGSITLFSQILGERSFVFCLVLVSLALMLPFIDNIDQRWRATLLASARVPKETLELKNELLRSFPLSAFSEAQLVTARQALKLTDNHPNSGSTADENNKSDDNNSDDNNSDDNNSDDNNSDDNKQFHELVQMLLHAYCIVDIIRNCEPSHLDNENIDGIESRLKEIAAVSNGIDLRESTRRTSI